VIERSGESKRRSMRYTCRLENSSEKNGREHIKLRSVAKGDISVETFLIDVRWKENPKMR
jgi:hypothetical protein